ncbi:MAG: hypothetical protein GX071_13520 [Gammaproteobacteria bacterium]|jgi:hypothetical protein|nr:hypothetical protein [Gammaproteobacteria bacterium]
MLHHLLALVLVFAAGAILGRLLPDLGELNMLGLLTIAADVATLCAAVAAVYALGAWRQQIKSQKAYDALALVLTSFWDKKLLAATLKTVAGGEEDRRKTRHELQHLARDSRRCADELLVLGYSQSADRLTQAIAQLDSGMHRLLTLPPQTAAADVHAQAEPVLNSFVEQIHELQKQTFRSGPW